MLVIWFLQYESQKSKKVLNFYCYKETNSYPGKKKSFNGLKVITIF